MKLCKADISANLCHLVLHDCAARPRRQRDNDLRIHPGPGIDNLARHRAIAAYGSAPARRISMLHHIKTETLRDTGVTQIVPGFRYLPGGQDDMPEPFAAEP